MTSALEDLKRLPRHKLEKLADNMGRLIAWLDDERHAVPLISSDARKCIRSKMKEFISDAENDDQPA